jgi:excisionase family DNA binding protein
VQGRVPKVPIGDGHQPDGNTTSHLVATSGASTLTIAEAATVLGLHPKTAYRLIRRGQFPIPVLHIGRTMRVSRIMLDRYLSTGVAA